MHILILGTTESGKTTLARQLCESYAAAGEVCIVLDKYDWTDGGRPKWPGATKVYKHPAAFLKAAQINRELFLFVDEAADSCGQWDKPMVWLARESRKYGHTCHFITTRSAEINTTIKRNCTAVALFACTANDAADIAREYNNKMFLDASDLKRGEYLFGTRFGEVRRVKLF